MLCCFTLPLLCSKVLCMFLLTTNDLICRVEGTITMVETYLYCDKKKWFPLFRNCYRRNELLYLKYVKTFFYLTLSSGYLVMFAWVKNKPIELPFLKTVDSIILLTEYTWNSVLMESYSPKKAVVESHYVTFILLSERIGGEGLKIN